MSEQPRKSDWARRSIPIWVVVIALALPWVGNLGSTPNEAGESSVSERVARTEGRAGRRRPRVNRPVRAEPVAREKTDLSAYEGLGSWIDIYNEWPWDHPQGAVNALRRRGVKTIFLQTSNYGADEPIFRPAQTEKFLHAAHRADMKVVAWYVPSFANPEFDKRRSLAPIRFKTSRGHKFDSFGMDIEATVVDRISLRNKRFLKLAKWLRGKIGDDYPLGAITPDPVTGLYWPDFPYKQTRRLFDVFVPMGYFSFTVSGYRDVKSYTVAGIKKIRRETEDPKVPIHWIGGIAGETEDYEVKGFVRALKGHKALGGSYYDFSITTAEEWSELRVIAGRKPPERKEKPEPKAPPKKEKSDKPKKKNDKKKHRGDKRKDRDGKKSSDGKDSKKKELKKKTESTQDDTELEEEPNARRLLWSAP